LAGVLNMEINTESRRVGITAADLRCHYDRTRFNRINRAYTAV